MCEILREFLKYCREREGVKHRIEASVCTVWWAGKCGWKTFNQDSGPSEPFLLQGGFLTSSRCLAWELVRNAKHRLPYPRPADMETPGAEEALFLQALPCDSDAYRSEKHW